MAIFERSQLKNGINLFVHPTKKFKTILVQLVFHRQLREEDVTASALLPSVLERGSVKYPTRRDLAQRLEELYGTEFTADVAKKGERQFVIFSLDLVHDQYLPGESRLLRQALEILGDIVLNPLVDKDSFKDDFVRQEKEQHEKVIKGLINDKMAYSMDRCLQAMCKDEPFGVFKYGTVERLQEIDAASLYQFYQRFLAESPVDLHIIGDVDVAAVASLAEDVFAFSRGKEDTVPATEVVKEVDEVRYVREELDVNQGKLVLGFRTGLSYADDDYFPLLVYNGILGAFPHSKLFQNVREKASLAYYAYSRLEKHKGLMVISSGIEVKDYDQALDIIRKQIDDMMEADFSQEVFDNTIIGLRNQFLVEEDSAGLVVNRALDGMLAGRHENTKELVKRLNAVTRDDVARVAKQINLDTVYFLTQKGGA